jgi:phosphopantetheine adenylyltransferase
MMEIKILNGKFKYSEAFELIEKLMKVKIAFHEDKIIQNSSEEEIKMREARIKELQNDLHNFKTEFNKDASQVINLSCFLEIQK